MREHDVDQFLRRKLAKSDDGRLLVLESGTGVGQHGAFWYLDTKSREAKLEVFVVNAGATQAAHELQAAVFSRPRGGFVIFWSLVSIYRALNLNMFGGVASRWAWQSMPSFDRVVAAHFPGQVLRSQVYGADEDAAGTNSDRCLPFHSISSVAWLLLLCRWAGASNRNGGLRSDAHRLAALAFLQSLVRAGCDSASSPLVVLVDDGYGWQWPRPLAGSDALELPVEDSGRGGSIGESFRSRQGQFIIARLRPRCCLPLRNRLLDLWQVGALLGAYLCLGAKSIPWRSNDHVLRQRRGVRVGLRCAPIRRQHAPHTFGAAQTS